MKLLSVKKVGRLNFKFSVFGRNFSDHSFYVMDAVFFDRAAVELIEILTGGTDVYIEYINVGVGIFVSYKHCVLCGIHTADLRAVFFTLIRARRAA